MRACAGAAANTTYCTGELGAGIPGGCATLNVQGTTYYLFRNTWFSHSYGANGVHYRVVPAL
jgi:hypothetical protein